MPTCGVGPMTLSNCTRCSGLLVPDEDDLHCVNCGRRFYFGQLADDLGKNGNEGEAVEEPEPEPWGGPLLELE